VQGGENSITQYPRKIRLERPHDDYRLEMSISKVAVNEPFEAERFRLEPPAGAEIVHLGEGSGNKQP
jgi:outer membrane lipoprotein-sorting protein